MGKHREYGYKDLRLYEVPGEPQIGVMDELTADLQRAQRVAEKRISHEMDEFIAELERVVREASRKDEDPELLIWTNT